jgi:hypothetical protein
LGGNAKDAIQSSQCAPELKARALRSLVDGLVVWQEREIEQGRSPQSTLNFLLALNKDPRFTPTRWRDKVDPRSTTAVRAWLSQRTIESFFRVIDALRTDSEHMWKARRAFWLQFLPHITDAWLVAGKQAAEIAELEEVDFGRFTSGDGTLGKHCGLMMQIRELCILEMNMNGAAILWRAGLKTLPSLYQKSYSRRRILDEASDGRFVHIGSWEGRLRDEIHKRTGIYVRM